MQFAWMTDAFPQPIAAEAASAFSLIPPTRQQPRRRFEITTTLGRVSVPDRIYNEVPPLDTAVSEVARLAIACLYTRHHDGRVREHFARSIVGSAQPWVVPFVVHLVGEYVVEILEVIRQALLDSPPDQRAACGEFLALNPAYWSRTESRVVSYWSRYHRQHWPTLDNYPGHVVARWLRAAAVERGAPLLPCRIPARRTTPVTGSGHRSGPS